VSFDEIVNFREQILRAKDDVDGVPIVLIGNKCDLSNQREVSTEEGKKLASSFGCPFLETSAQANLNIAESFQEVVREYVKKQSTSGKKEEKKKSGGCVYL